MILRIWFFRLIYRPGGVLISSFFIYWLIGLKAFSCVSERDWFRQCHYQTKPYLVTPSFFPESLIRICETLVCLNASMKQIMYGLYCVIWLCYVVEFYSNVYFIIRHFWNSQHFIKYSLKRLNNNKISFISFFCTFLKTKIINVQLYYV